MVVVAVGGGKEVKPDFVGFIAGVIAGYYAGLLIGFNLLNNLIMLGLFAPVLLLPLALFYFKKMSLRDLTAFVSIGFLVFFVLYIGSAVFVYPSHLTNENGYDSWLFHGCYMQSFNARACSISVVDALRHDNGGYDYYPPLTHVLARLITMQGVMFLAIFGIWFLLLVGTNSFIAPLIVFFTAPSVWFSYVKGGAFPLHFLFLLVVVAILYWRRLGLWSKIGLTIAALLTHNYGGWFFVLLALTLEFTPAKIRNAAVLFLGLFTSFYVLFYVDPINPRGLQLGLVVLGALFTSFFDETSWELSFDEGSKQA